MRRKSAVFIAIEPLRTNAVTRTLPVRRLPCVAVGEKPSAIVRRQARDSARAGSRSSDRMEAPAGTAYPSPFSLPGGAGLIQPAGLARPQIGLQSAGGAPGNCAPHTVTEINFGLRFAENGASRVTRQTWTTVNVSENRYKCSIFLRPPSPHAGGDARAPTRRVLRRTQAGTPAHPGRAWFSHAAPRSQGSLFTSPHPLPFQPSGRPNTPFSPCGRRGQGG